jgi:hypothetical protein
MALGGGRLLDFLSCLSAPLPNERISTMSETTTRIDQADEELLTFDISDEALEATAGTVREKAANYTLGACSGLSVCPA